jgi:histidinol phosphatase-like PHP family hydrolase
MHETRVTNPERYDLHLHSDFSDGQATVRILTERAASLDLDTIAITDHFWPCLGSRKGGKQLIEQRRDQIWNLRSVFKSLSILDGAEIDISSNGMPAPIADDLSRFDIIIGSFHFSLSSTQWRSAVEHAASSWRFDILGHWDGYLSSFREEDGAAVAKILADNGIAVEISARYVTQYPEFFEMARNAGCQFTLGSDSHTAAEVGKLNEQVQLARALDLHLRTLPKLR